MFSETEIVLPVDIEKEMKKSFIEYSMSVIVSRALPDVRDGLKPVHRRILYTLHENGLTPDKAYRKCADTVGAVLGRYHPHGDASVYDALVRLAQPFSLRYPLVTATATSAPWTEIRRRHIVIRKREWRKSLWRC